MRRNQEILEGTSLRKDLHARQKEDLAGDCRDADPSRETEKDIQMST